MAPSSDEETPTITAILPSIDVYSSVSEEDAGISDRDVSAPFKSKHLIWHCQVHGLTADFPVMTCALINNGAHVILIRPELVAKLGLKKYHLHMPELIDVAMNNDQNSRSQLHDYIKLSLVSLDAVWTSKTVKALITPGLCMPIILGLPFLIHNTIITDHASCTCIDKCSQYDLLNPLLVSPPPPPKPHLKEQLKETKADKNLMLAELMLVTNNRLKNHKFRPEIVDKIDVVGAIRD